MRPPICAICRQRFEPFEGEAGLVSFARDPADADWYRRAEAPGFVGHPPHQDWFCATHAVLARAHGSQTKRDALRDVRVVVSAMACGPLAAGHVRVFVHEDDGRTQPHDFPTLAQAQQYADDVASESGEASAVITDGTRVVARGRHYAAR